MALQPKKGGTIHSKTGDAKNALKDRYDAGDHTVLENYPAEAALLYQMQQMSEDIDELRRYLTAEVGNGAQGPQGPAGAKGDTGDAGADGSNGSNGSTGARGAAGPAGGVYGNIIKILPTEFMGNDDVSYERTVIEDDVRGKLGVRVASSSQEIFASTTIPEGKKVTGYAVYSSSSVSTYLNGIVLSTGVSSEIGNGNSGAVINLKTAYNSAETNYVAIKVMTTSTGQVIYGAVIIIADI
tara:strand:+ start:864 stop:1583 length:720 start_codon:yes stop_codon:yes gene_type:complete